MGRSGRVGGKNNPGGTESKHTSDCGKQLLPRGARKDSTSSDDERCSSSKRRGAGGRGFAVGLLARVPRSLLWLSRAPSVVRRAGEPK